MSALEDVTAERARQDAKWGAQNHPDGTGPESLPLYVEAATGIADDDEAKFIAESMKGRTDARFSGAGDRPGTWADILLEEVFEACAEVDPAALRTELIQVAAVATAWAEAIDRREAVPTPRPHTPDVALPGGGKRITVKRACNGCDRLIGDATAVELDAAVEGRPLPDVRDECGCNR